MMTVKGVSLKYRPEIDGLRTVAVIPVILFHLSQSLVKGGYYGVDVFFVISGYLITKILTSSIENGSFSMYEFWIRRVKRLFPMVLTVVLVTLMVSILFVFKPVVKEISMDIFPAIFSYFNFHALYNFGDYWGSKSEQSFFLHTWSLSVEEQFYLIYPFFLFLCHKYFRTFILPVSFVTIISFLLFVYFLNTNQDVAFYILPTRIWELSLGGLAGLVNFKYSKISKYSFIFPIVGVLMISWSFFFAETTISEVAVLPVIGSVLIIIFCIPKDPIGRILSSKLFVFLGKISYSLYLWHVVIIVMLKHNLRYLLGDSNDYVLAVVIMGLTFTLACLSYTFIENKTRNYQHTPKLVLMGVMLISALAFFYKSDLFDPFYESKYNKQVSYFSYYNILPKPGAADISSAFFHDMSIIPRPKKFSTAYKDEGIISSNENGVPEILLLGDSHGIMWAKLLDEVAEEIDVTLSCYTANGTWPYFNTKQLSNQVATKYFSKDQRVEYAKSIATNIEKWNPKLVVIACLWHPLDKKKREELNELLLFLQEKDLSIMLITQPPRLKFAGDHRNIAQYFTYLGINPSDDYNLISVDNSNIIATNRYLESLTSKYKKLTIYDAYANMILDGKVKISLGKEVFYHDDDHLSYHGTLEHKKNILNQIRMMMSSVE